MWLFFQPSFPYLQHIITHFAPHLSAFNDTKIHDVDDVLTFPIIIHQLHRKILFMF